MAGIAITLKANPDWLFTVEIFRLPNGDLLASVKDARATVIEGEDAAGKLLDLADMLTQGAEGLRAQAGEMKQKAGAK